MSLVSALLSAFARTRRVPSSGWKVLTGKEKRDVNKGKRAMKAGYLDARGNFRVFASMLPRYSVPVIPADFKLKPYVANSPRDLKDPRVVRAERRVARIEAREREREQQELQQRRLQQLLLRRRRQQRQGLAAAAPGAGGGGAGGGGGGGAGPTTQRQWQQQQLQAGSGGGSGSSAGGGGGAGGALRSR